MSTLAGLTSSAETVRSSTLKRAILRKDPTFSEADLGFRTFGALLASLQDEGLVSLEGTGDPIVSMSGTTVAEQADQLLTAVIADVGEVPLSGLKTAMKKRDPDFSERRLGSRNFGAFVRSAEARNLVQLTGKPNAVIVKGPRTRRRSEPARDGSFSSRRRRRPTR